jgi:hypothetical protein
LPGGLTALTYLDISESPLNDITLPADLGQLATLRLSQNKLSGLILPAGLTNLTGLNLSGNQLTNVVLPSDLARLDSLNLNGNELSNLILPSGLASLTGLFFVGNQLTSVTLPPDMRQLSALGFLANPLTSVVLSEELAGGNLAETVASLQNQGTSVFTYPLTVRLIRLRQLLGAFQFAVTGPPGAYVVLASSDLATWSELGVATNQLGVIVFTDLTADLSAQKFYRVRSSN